MAMPDTLIDALRGIERNQYENPLYDDMEDQIEYVKHAMFDLLLYIAVSETSLAKKCVKKLPARKRKKTSIFPARLRRALHDTEQAAFLDDLMDMRDPSRERPLIRDTRIEHAVRSYVSPKAVAMSLYDKPVSRESAQT